MIHNLVAPRDSCLTNGSVAVTGKRWFKSLLLKIDGAILFIGFIEFQQLSNYFKIQNMFESLLKLWTVVHKDKTTFQIHNLSRSNDGKTYQDLIET